MVIFDMNQAAEFIRLSKSYLYKLTSARKIPHFKKGKKIYFKQEELEDWMLSDPVPT